MKPTSNHKEMIENQFVSFCKSVLRNEARNIYSEGKRWNEKFISLTQIIEMQPHELCTCDSYEADFHTYDKVVLIKDMVIAEALMTLPKRQLDVILHSFFLGVTDVDIALLMAIDKSTVHYHKKRALDELRKFLEEEH